MSIGGTLAEARRQAGLSRAQVSQRTRIRESIISSIEQGDFSSCGGDFYARGHIRSLAGAVGTDPVVLVREYDEEHGQPAPLRAAQVFESATPIRIREPRRLRLGWVIAVAALAVAGFVGYRVLAAPGPSPAAAASRVRPITSPRATAGTAGHKSAAGDKKTAGDKKAAGDKAHPAAGPRAVIRLTASQACWVSLSGSGGRSLYQGTIQAGASLTWREKHAVSLVIGNPPGVTLTVNGKAEQMNTVQVVTLSIDPLSKTPVTVG